MYESLSLEGQRPTSVIEAIQSGNYARKPIKLITINSTSPHKLRLGNYHLKTRRQIITHGKQEKPFPSMRSAFLPSIEMSLRPQEHTFSGYSGAYQPIMIHFPGEDGLILLANDLIQSKCVMVKKLQPNSLTNNRDRDEQRERTTERKQDVLLNKNDLCRK